MGVIMASERGKGDGALNTVPQRAGVVPCFTLLCPRPRNKKTKRARAVKGEAERSEAERSGERASARVP